MTKVLTLDQSLLSSSGGSPQDRSRFSHYGERRERQVDRVAAPSPLHRFWQSLGQVLRPQSASKPKPRRRSLQIRWVLPGKLAIGALPRRGDSMMLAQAGIAAVLSLCAEQEGCLPEDVAGSFFCGRTVLPDSHYTYDLDPEQLLKAVEVVDRCVQSGMPIYVHCLGGIERAPLVCISYLCLHRGLELSEALLWIKQVNSRTNPTDKQLQILSRCIHQAGSARSHSSRGTPRI